MIKILLIDDDRATNFYNQHVLKKSEVDFEIVTLDSALKALEYIKNVNLPDIILLDVNMPIMDGIQFLEEAQKWSTDEFSKVRVFVMMSVDLTEDTLQRLNNAREVEIIKGKMLTPSDIDCFKLKAMK